MTTAGWLLILFAGLLVRGVIKGRALTDLPGDLGDLFTAAVTGDNVKLAEVFSRKGEGWVADTPVQDNTIQDMPTTGDSVTSLVTFGKKLQQMDYNVAEHSKFGGVKKGAHVKGSQHYIDEAIDVNADTGFRGGEKAALDNANNMAKAAGFTTIWQTSGHYDHLHVAVKK